MLGSTVPGQEVLSEPYLVCVANVVIPGILFGPVTNLLHIIVVNSP